MPASGIMMSPAKHYCPSCGAWLKPAAEVCPRCQFTATVCLQRFPLQAPRLERLLDVEKRLTSADRDRLDRGIDSFESTFPQVGVHVCITCLPEAADCREFGHWLFNAATPRDSREEARRYFSLLLVIDRGNRYASITTGYRLNQFIDDFPLHRLLEQSRDALRCGKYTDGILSFVENFKRILKPVHRKAVREYLHDAGRHRRRSRALLARPGASNDSSDPKHAVSGH